MDHLQLSHQSWPLTNFTGKKKPNIYLNMGVERVLQTNTDGGTFIFKWGQKKKKKLTDYSRQSALTDCKNKMAIYFVFRMLHIFAWHKRTVWSHPYQAVSDKYSACLLLNTASATDMYTIAQTSQVIRTSNQSRLKVRQGSIRSYQDGQHKFLKSYSHL